jgi:hypothetical protein
MRSAQDAAVRGGDGKNRELQITAGPFYWCYHTLHLVGPNVKKDHNCLVTTNIASMPPRRTATAVPQIDSTPVVRVRLKMIG